MTEAEWLAREYPKPMVECLTRGESVRKHRLFAVACCRRIWPLLTSVLGRKWVEMAERLADGLPVNEHDLEAGRENYWEKFQYHDMAPEDRDNR